MHQGEVERLLQSGDLDAAASAVQRWLDAEPGRLLALQYQGMIRLWLGEAAAAEESFRAALADAPELPRNQANLAIALLSQGKYREGLPLYEARYAGVAAHDGVSFGGLDEARRWRGGDLAGKRLLLVREQGLGDQIQFIRFVPRLRALGATQVIASVSTRLRVLLSSAPGLDLATDEDVAPDAYDLWCPLLSVPLLLGLEGPQAPDTLPYLTAPETRLLQWRRLVDEWVGSRPAIGISWAGSGGNAIDSRRSLSLDQVFELVEARGDAVVLSMQMGDPGMERIEQQCRSGIIPLLDMQRDMADAAAIISRLDLLISVDTATAHLAGALGQPVWLLLPAGADWRWGAEHDATPWYPSMRIFRQRQPGNWGEVMGRVKQELRGFSHPI
ncbi:glycosyltransferase family 9 protein [Viridibacterium curvum]|uniref:Tetratricopeptide repeat protein n=1 Tax=Viridibacterium curvum TaxID=1101404 RepID=A0ABP9QT76_9RHOO